MLGLFQTRKVKLAALATGAAVMAGVLLWAGPATQDVLGQTGPTGGAGNPAAGAPIPGGGDNPFVAGQGGLPARIVVAAVNQDVTIPDGEDAGIVNSGVIAIVDNETPHDIVVTPVAVDSIGAAMVVSIRFSDRVSRPIIVELSRPGSNAVEQTIECDSTPCEVSIPDGWTATVRLA